MTTTNDMHYKSAKANDAAQKPQRKALRNNMTPAEALLWRSLRGSRVGGWKWRRQQGIGPFVLDFYCPALRLCIELDGSAHDYTYEYDEQRTHYLNAQDIRVVRFGNDQVFNSCDGVVAEIIRICSERQGEVTDPTNPPNPKNLPRRLRRYRPHPQPLPLKGGESRGKQIKKQ